MTGARLVLAAIVFGWAADTLAAEAPSGSACPREPEIWAVVATLIPPERLPPPAQRPRLVIVDLGASYRIEVEDRRREFHDPARDCGGRAEASAVFVALTLSPPEAPRRPPPPPPLAQPPGDSSPEPALAASPPVAPSPPLTAGWQVVAEAALWGGAVRTTDETAGPAGGLMVRVAATSGPLGFVAGLAAGPPTRVQVGATPVEQVRAPFDAGIRLQWRGARMTGVADLSAVVALLRVNAEGSPVVSSRVDFGVRGGAALILGAGRWAPVVGIMAEMVPAPLAIALQPQGVVGKMPWLHVGASFGLRVRF